MFLDSLQPDEKEAILLEIEKGKNVWEAIASLPVVRPELFRLAAEERGYEFVPAPPESARKEGEIFVDHDRRTVYTWNPSIVPSELTDYEIVIVPPVPGREEGDEDNFWLNLIKQAVLSGWGDIHYEPTPAAYRVRVRNSLGRIETVRTLDKEVGQRLLRQFLTLADAKTSNLNVPIDASINFRDVTSTEPSKKKLRDFLEKLKATPCDMRVSVIPTVNGPSCVIRILPKNQKLRSLEELGYSLQHIERLSGYPLLSKGMILVVGPTGSGKSTLIRAMALMADPEKRKIVSIEDPVEAEIPGVQQVEVRLPVYDDDGKLIGIDFAHAIRAFMRQNPDVILVGEIRDRETARAAIAASNTGHLLISTLHANDEVEAIKRLLDLAQDPDIAKVVNQMRLIVAQRLVPRVCPRCRELGLFPRVEINDQFLARLPVETRELLDEKLKGQMVLSRQIKQTCGQCKGGFVGRIPVLGILEFNREIRDFIIGSGGTFETEEFLSHAKKWGFRPYSDDVLERVRQEEVTIEDALEIL
ncbi:type II secretion system protein E (plasmid) [Thermovibrio ammonificans HB-1]|uniref:Type II secretion system protein E n=1 Tax=Thermovibrio ammonificans (strain DSM 15698 / JCM 12110 / HB-1) TaxID=648996 RepID=E8T6T7_THEA1|nr:ATPase, T2SS/T4P/T4SS family [Thermovibrio ammonificans]ADU97760.1 type II secretion system protein E [Thermovibrio ammonificans HB-1]